MTATLRFLWSYLRPRPGTVAESLVHYRRGGEQLEATLYQPKRGGGHPGWVILHGLAHTGRHHASLQRFARAVAASGAAVMVPDIPEWRRLRVAPAVTVPTIQAAVLALNERPEVERGRVGLIGFSFGATQALVAAADPRLEGHLRGIAAWGGYRDLHRLFRFGLLGRHELDGRQYRTAPDPYGRWIMAANYLTKVPGYEEFGDTAAALDRLANEAGSRGVYADDPVYDPIKEEFRDPLEPRARELFDFFAPPAGRLPPDTSETEALAEGLASAALAADPLLDPGPRLNRLGVRTVFAHGRDDRLVPFTESIRLERDLPPEVSGGCTVTDLFSHSGGTDRSLGLRGTARQGLRFARVLNRIFRLI